MFRDVSGLPFVVAALVVIFDVAVRLYALVVVPRGRRPAASMAWLLAIFFAPLVGSIVFLIIGSPHLPRALRDKQQHMNAMIAAAVTEVDHIVDEDPEPPWIRPIVRLNQRLCAMPMVRGNSAALLAD